MTKKEMLELMIFANEAEIDATYEAMKKFAGVTELNGRLMVLQAVNTKLKIKAKDIDAV